MPETAAVEINKEQFQKEQDELLSSLLEARYFNPWRGLVAVNDETSLQHDSGLEIFITSSCNQKCDYCYLHKHEELYPLQCRDEETIIRNLTLLYDYILTNNFAIPCVDLFSGEIWHTEFGIVILEITLDYIKRGMKFPYILIPSNCSFILNQEQFDKIQSLINEFAQYNSRLTFSISIDGKFIDNEGRPRNNGELYSDDFYEKLFTFAKANMFYFHPMISAHNVDKWIENYDWWMEQLDYYQLPLRSTMMLEVRNPDWTDDNLKSYSKLLNHMLNHILKRYCKNDITILARLIGNIRTDEELASLIHGYIPWAIPVNNDFPACTIATQLVVRLGDLAICPCHRTAYDKYLYGKFNVENDMITNITAQNPYMAIKVLMGSTHVVYPNCNKCLLNHTCLKGCLGVQVEEYSDPFFPVENVCKFFRNKVYTLIRYYRENGIISYYKTIGKYEFNRENVDLILEIDSKIDEEEKFNGLGICE